MNGIKFAVHGTQIMHKGKEYIAMSAPGCIGCAFHRLSSGRCEVADNDKIPYCNTNIWVTPIDAVIYELTGKVPNGRS